jgi:hypothetical protein
MEWNRENLRLLEKAFLARWFRLKGENRTDRKNLSEIWNRKLRLLGISVLRPKGKAESVGVNDFVELLNFRNEQTADILCVSNPDRLGQFLIVPRDMASKILMLGMP